jgi:hypothetical protein
MIFRMSEFTVCVRHFVLFSCHGGSGKGGIDTKEKGEFTHLPGCGQAHSTVLSQSGKKPAFEEYKSRYEQEPDSDKVPHLVETITWRNYIAAYHNAVRNKVLEKVLVQLATQNMLKVR